MIADHLSNWKQYAGLGKNFEAAFRFAQNADPAAIETGRHEIDGENAYAIVVDRELTEVPVLWEMHERYADVHLILDGSETVGCYPISRLQSVPAFDRDTDSAVVEGIEGAMIGLEKGEFVIALPQDVHLPNCPGKGGPYSRKMILKVLLDGQ